MKNENIKHNLLFAFILTLLYFLHCAVLNPLYISICSDVIWLESYLPYVFELLLEICQLLIWVHLVSNLIFAVKKQNVVFFTVSTFLLTLLRYLYAPIVNITKGNALDVTDILGAFKYFAVDILVLAIIFSVVFFTKNKAFSMNLKIGALVSAILLSVSKISTRIIFDIFYGLPVSLAELSIMILYYFFDVVYGVAAYFLIYYTAKLLLKEKNSD